MHRRPGGSLRAAPWSFGKSRALNRTSEAVRIYRRLVRRGVKSLALGDCGEGMAWARGLVADCWYRIALCHDLSRRRKLALKAFAQHMRLRGPGCRSTYPIAEVRREQRAVLRQEIKDLGEYPVIVGHLVEIAATRRWSCPPPHGQKKWPDLPPCDLWDRELDG